MPRQPSTTTATMIPAGLRFETVADAKEVILRMLLEAKLLWAVYKSDSTLLLLQCRDKTCGFRIRVAYSKKIGEALVAAYTAHDCNPSTHFIFGQSKSIKYLKEGHRAAVLDERDMKPGTSTALFTFY